MSKDFLILLLSVFLLFACSKKDNAEIVSDLNEEEMNRVFATLGVLGENQMSSAERDAAGISQPGSRN